MSLYKAYSTSTDAEINGTRIVFDEDDGKEVSLTLARAGGKNTQYGKVLTKLMKPHRKAAAINMLSEETARGVMIEVYADTVVKGWENVTDANGNALPFNRENVIKLFTDLPDFFSEVQEKATPMELFKSEVEETVKN